MINGVKKLEFIFKTSVAHTETINPIYWVPTIHQKKQNQTIKFQKEAILYHKTLILVCVPPFQKKKSKRFLQFIETFSGCNFSKPNLAFKYEMKLILVFRKGKQKSSDQQGVSCRNLLDVNDNIS